MGTPRQKRVRRNSELDPEPRLSPNRKSVRRPIPPHITDALESRSPGRPQETTGQYVTQTFALNGRHESVRSPHQADLPRPGPGTSPRMPPRQANPAQRRLSRDGERMVARPEASKSHELPARKGPVGISLQGGGLPVGSPRRNDFESPTAARTPDRHPVRRLPSASPGRTQPSPHIPDEVRAMDAKICPNISPEEMDVLRKLYLAVKQHPEKKGQYEQQYKVYQQQLQAQKRLSGGKQPTKTIASPTAETLPRLTVEKPQVHQPQRPLEQAHYRPTYSPQQGSKTIFRGGNTSPSNTPAATRQRPDVPSPGFRTQQTLPDTPQTGGNHQRKRSGPILPRIILKVPQRTQDSRQGISPVKGGFPRDIMSSPKKEQGSMGGKSLKRPPPVEEQEQEEALGNNDD